MYSGGQRISLGNRTQSRPVQPWEGSSPVRVQASGAGHHRDLRSGHAFRGVIRELGRASRLLGREHRRWGDRCEQHPGDHGTTQAVGEPTLAQVRGDTNHGASTQGTGREPEANQPGRTKVVVATRSTAGIGTDRLRDWRRGELRPKGPTIAATRRREGEAGHDLWAREIQE